MRASRSPGRYDQSHSLQITGCGRKPLSRGHAVIGVAARRLNPHPHPASARAHAARLLGKSGCRGECEISFVLPLSTPEPPSSETSKALIAAPLLKEPMIRCLPLWRIQLPDQSVLSPVSITNTASRGEIAHHTRHSLRMNTDRTACPASRSRFCAGPRRFRRICCRSSASPERAMI
jgi:hypothetical protein